MRQKIVVGLSLLVIASLILISQQVSPDATVEGRGHSQAPQYVAESKTLVCVANYTITNGSGASDCSLKFFNVTFNDVADFVAGDIASVSVWNETSGNDKFSTDDTLVSSYVTLEKVADKKYQANFTDLALGTTIGKRDIYVVINTSADAGDNHKFNVSIQADHIVLKNAADQLLKTPSSELFEDFTITIDSALPTVTWEGIKDSLADDWINGDLEFNLTAEDTVSGVKNITYRWYNASNDTWSSWMEYTENVTLGLGTKDDKTFWVEYKAYDNVDHNSTLVNKTFKTDFTLPEVIEHLVNNSANVICTIPAIETNATEYFSNVTDALSGAYQVAFSLNSTNWTGWESVNLQQNITGNKKAYHKKAINLNNTTIGGLEDTPDGVYTYYVKVRDKAGNEKVSTKLKKVLIREPLSNYIWNWDNKDDKVVNSSKPLNVAFKLDGEAGQTTYYAPQDKWEGSLNWTVEWLHRGRWYVSINGTRINFSKLITRRLFIDTSGVGTTLWDPVAKAKRDLDGYDIIYKVAVKYKDQWDDEIKLKSTAREGIHTFNWIGDYMINVTFTDCINRTDYFLINMVPYYKIVLKRGWNFIAPSAMNPKYTVNNFLTMAGIDGIVLRDKARGEYRSYWQSIPGDLSCDNYTGLYIHCTEDTVLKVTGEVPEKKILTFLKGWNTFGIVCNDTTARALLDRTEGAKAICIKDLETGKYKTYIKGMGYDFEVKRGMGIFINVDRDTTFIEA